MKENITELVFVLDRSGSMAGLETDTIGGFNSMISRQRTQEGKCYVSTFLFDNTIEIVHDRILLGDVEKMSQKDYVVRGSTALFDALGNAICHISNIHRYSRSEDVPQNTIFVITTDGMENSSHKYTNEEIKKLIEEKKEKHGWEFMFLAANIDAVQTAKTFGIDENRSVNYHADSIGTACLYETVAETLCSVRAGEVISDNWCEKIKGDYESRKKSRE